MRDRGGVALALQSQFVVVDGARSVGGEHQFQVDFLRHRRAGEGGHDGNNDEKQR